jgi:hypothetical protein
VVLTHPPPHKKGRPIPLPTLRALVAYKGGTFTKEGLVPAVIYFVREIHYSQITSYSRDVDKLRVAHLVSIFRTLYGIRRLFTVLTRVFVVVNETVYKSL